MKKMFCAGAALAMLASAASAHPEGLGGPRASAEPVTQAAVQARIEARFARADEDRDGFVTQAEAKASAAAIRSAHQARRAGRGGGRGDVFTRLDSNRDGQISRAEFESRPVLRRGGAGAGTGGGLFARLGARQFAAADSNRDGRLSKEEARTGAMALFARFDTDRNGEISIEERRAAREAFGAARQRRRG